MRLRAPSTWITVIALVGLNLWTYMSAHWEELVGVGRVARNSPFSLYMAFMVSTFWAAVVGAAYMTAPLLRDVRTRIAPVVYGCPVSDQAYFWGKYLAGMAGLFVALSSMVIAAMVLPIVGPWLSPPVPGEYMPTPWAHIAHATLLFVLPGTFFSGTVHFVLAATTGKVTPSYALAAVFLLLWAGLTVALEEASTIPMLAQLIDPLGKLPLEVLMAKWPPTLRMNEFVSFWGPVGINRLIYVGAAALLLAVTAARFDLRKLLFKTKLAKAPAQEVTRTFVAPVCALRGRTVSPIPFSTSLSRQLVQSLSLGWRDFSMCFKEVPFLLLAFMCAVFSITGAFKIYNLGHMYEGILLPVTIDVMQLANDSFFIGGLMTLLYYAGEIMARDRLARMHLITDAAPTADWAQVLQKITAIALLALFLSLIPAAVTVITQLAHGYFDGDIATYLRRTGLLLFPSLLAYGIFAAILHGITGQRGLGHGLTVGLALAILIGHDTEFITHPLVKWGLSGFGSVFSAFDAFDQFNQKLLQVGGYWLLLSVALLTVSYWVWPRGVDLSGRARRMTLSRNLNAASVAFFGVVLSGAATLGWFIHQGAVVANNFMPHDKELAERADYERRYSSLRGLNQPKITQADLQVDLYPARRSAAYSGRLTVANLGGGEIRELHLETPEFGKLLTVYWNDTPLRARRIDHEHDHYVFDLPMPLAQGAEARLFVEMQVTYANYLPREFHGTLVADGSVFPASMWPGFGYDVKRELVRNSERLKQQLGPRTLPPSIENASTMRDIYRMDDADLVHYSLRVSTPANQIPVAPGQLLEETVEDGRRSRVYRSRLSTVWDVPISSAAYAVAKDEWAAWNAEERAPVAIEIFHHPRHGQNAQHFVEAARLSLTRLSDLLGPYPYDSVRIAEVPTEIIDATSAGGVILLPELKGWTHDYRGNQSFDYILYAVARHLAKAWLAGDAPPGDLRGALVLEEALPALIALNLVAEKNGEAMVQRYLSNENEFYLAERVREDDTEPAVIDGYDQEYMFAKALVALNAAQTILGEEAMAAAIRAFARQARAESATRFAGLDQLIAALYAGAVRTEDRMRLAEIFEASSGVDPGSQPVSTAGHGSK